MPFRLFTTNYLQKNGVIITPSSEDPELPGVNVIDDVKAKMWRTNSEAISTLTFDMSSPLCATFFPPNYFILLNSELVLNNHMGISIQASDDNFATIAYQQTIIPNGPFNDVALQAPDIPAYFNYGAIWGELQGDEISRLHPYWRFRIDKGAATVPMSFGKMWLGRKVDLSRGPDLGGIDFNPQDGSKIQDTIGQQQYAFVKRQFDMPTINFSYLSVEDTQLLHQAGIDMGTHTSFFMQIEQNGETNVSQYYSNELSKLYYVKFVNLPTRKFALKSPSISFLTGLTDRMGRFPSTLVFREQI